MSEVSVIIPTLSSAESLDRCLTSIVMNNTKHKLELIIVDGGSTDETRNIATKYTDRIIVEKGCFRGTARNIGVKSAHGKIVCFTDSDCVVPKNWVTELVDNLLELNGKDERMVGVGGGNVPLIEGSSLVELAISAVVRSPLVSYKARNMSVYGNAHENLHNPPVNSAYFKWVVEEVGGFGEEYNSGEDMELDAKIHEKGYKLYYLPNLTVYHKHRSSFKKFVKQMYNFGKARIRVGRKYRKFLDFHHYGPAVLCLMTFSPLFFIPLGLSLLNGVYLSFKEKRVLLFLPALALTMSFYVSYGLGEIVQLLVRK